MCEPNTVLEAGVLAVESGVESVHQPVGGRGCRKAEDRKHLCCRHETRTLGRRVLLLGLRAIVQVPDPSSVDDLQTSREERPVVAGCELAPAAEPEGSLRRSEGRTTADRHDPQVWSVVPPRPDRCISRQVLPQPEQAVPALGLGQAHAAEPLGHLRLGNPDGEALVDQLRHVTGGHCCAHGWQPSVSEMLRDRLGRPCLPDGPRKDDRPAGGDQGSGLGEDDVLARDCRVELLFDELAADPRRARIVEWHVGDQVVGLGSHGLRQRCVAGPSNERLRSEPPDPGEEPSVSG